MAVDKVKLKKFVQDQRKLKNDKGLQIDTDIANLQIQIDELVSLKAQIELDKADLDAQELEIDQLP